MASTTVPCTLLPAWAERVRNWLIDGQYARLEWNGDTPECTVRYWIHERVESIGESLLRAMFRREPVLETDLAYARAVLVVAELRAEECSPAGIS